jgi:hypothetical protein
LLSYWCSYILDEKQHSTERARHSNGLKVQLECGAINPSLHHTIPIIPIIDDNDSRSELLVLITYCFPQK